MLFQTAADIGVPENRKRAEGRVAFELVDGKPVYLDMTDKHDYKGMRPKLPNDVKNPLDGHLVQKKAFINLTDSNEEQKDHASSSEFKLIFNVAK